MKNIISPLVLIMFLNIINAQENIESSISKDYEKVILGSMPLPLKYDFEKDTLYYKRTKESIVNETNCSRDENIKFNDSTYSKNRVAYNCSFRFGLKKDIIKKRIVVDKDNDSSDLKVMTLVPSGQDYDDYTIGFKSIKNGKITGTNRCSVVLNKKGDISTITCAYINPTLSNYLLNLKKEKVNSFNIFLNYLQSDEYKKEEINILREVYKNTYETLHPNKPIKTKELNLSDFKFINSEEQLKMYSINSIESANNEMEEGSFLFSLYFYYQNEIIIKNGNLWMKEH